LKREISIRENKKPKQESVCSFPNYPVNNTVVSTKDESLNTTETLPANIQKTTQTSPQDTNIKSDNVPQVNVRQGGNCLGSLSIPLSCTLSKLRDRITQELTQSKFKFLTQDDAPVMVKQESDFTLLECVKNEGGEIFIDVRLQQ